MLGGERLRGPLLPPLRLVVVRGTEDVPAFGVIIMGAGLMEECWEDLDPGRLMQSVPIVVEEDGIFGSGMAPEDLDILEEEE